MSADGGSPGGGRLAVDLSKYHNRLERLDIVRQSGRVVQVIGLVIESNGPQAQVGEVCYIRPRSSRAPVTSEVVGFREGKLLLMPLGDMAGIEPGSKIVAGGKSLGVRVGDELLGRVLDGLGNPMDGKGPIHAVAEYPVSSSPPSPLARPRIAQPLTLGVRAIDGLLTCGSGQRVGIFSGSGVGKSTLLGMIARNTRADVNVIGLIGERGREVLEFIEGDLGEEGLARSVVVVATSDTPALVRIKGAMVATAIAEYFRDRGLNVMLMMDSVTRFAMAQREVGLAIGEPPATKGYTPSVFALLPKLLERSGASERGTITGLYTVLVDGDDLTEPIADAVRSILDGHIVLSRQLADRNHYPAIDVLKSVSRVMDNIVSPQHKLAAGRFRDILATYRESEDLINIGAYVGGSNARIDQAVEMIDSLNQYMRQAKEERASYEEAVDRLLALAG